MPIRGTILQITACEEIFSPPTTVRGDLGSTQLSGLKSI
jgi:hypothetical protein